MKLLSFISILLGIIGLLLILWFECQLNLRYEELGGLSDLVTLFKYGKAKYLILIISQLLGLSCGIIASSKGKLKSGWLGILICFITLIILLFQTS